MSEIVQVTISSTTQVSVSSASNSASVTKTLRPYSSLGGLPCVLGFGSGRTRRRRETRERARQRLREAEARQAAARLAQSRLDRENAMKDVEGERKGAEAENDEIQKPTAVHSDPVVESDRSNS